MYSGVLEDGGRCCLVVRGWVSMRRNFMRRRMRRGFAREVWEVEARIFSTVDVLWKGKGKVGPSGGGDLGRSADSLFVTLSISQS
jgi:hypothetical protein